MGEALEIAKVLVSPTEKLMDIISSGIGVLYEPRRKRKIADATAYEINKIGEAVRNNSDSIISYRDGSIELQNPDFSEFLQRTNYRIAYQELLKQKNIESVIDRTYYEMENKDFVVSDPVCVDWVSSFFDFVANVNDEQMQVLWSKLLQGEISKPGRFSIRTLDLLRKMTSYEANIFKKMIPYLLKGNDTASNNKTTLYLLEDVLDKIPGLTFDDFVRMKVAGIISYTSISIRCNLQHNEVEVFENLDKKIILKNNSEDEIEMVIVAYVLTEFGNDLYNITLENNTFYSDEEFLSICIKSFLDWNGIINPIKKEQVKCLECTIV